MHVLTVNRRALGYFPICQLVPEDKSQLLLNETGEKCLKTAKEPGVGGLILQLFLPGLHKYSHSCGFQRFSFETSRQPDSISRSSVFSMHLVTFKNHKKRDFFSLSSFLFARVFQSHIFVLSPVKADDDTLLLSDGLHGFLYKSVEFNNCIINLCRVSEITFFLPLISLP